MTEKKVIGLFSGGIDSPVACYLMSKKFRILPLHFCCFPFVRKENLYNTVEALKEFSRKVKIEKIFFYPWGRVLELIVEKAPKNYRCLLCKRGMLFVASKLCQKVGAFGVVTGDSIGQKASQTLHNLVILSKGLQYPIFRPLLGLNKIEIEHIAREVGLWQEKHAGGCLAVSPSPKTRGDVTKLDLLWTRLRLEEVVEHELNRLIQVQPEELDALSIEELKRI